jgi:Translationally controlled tumour protein
LEENAPDQVEVFKSNCNTVMKDILGRFKDLQFFTGESMDCDGMIAMMEYRDIDGVSTPILMVRILMCMMKQMQYY